VLCGIAPNLPFLIFARVLQGIGGGGLAPVEQSMLVDTFPPQKRGAAFAAYGVVVIVGPILGPSLGGWITDNMSWHWVFLINLPIGLLSLFLVNIFVDEPPALKKAAEEKKGKFDFVGFALIALFLGCLEVTLDRGQTDDWFASPVICTFAVVAVLSLIAFIPWELAQKQPVVEIRLFGQRNFLIANIFMMIMGVIVFGTTQFIPQLLQEVLHYTATNAGLALTMGGLATILMMPVSGYLTGKIDVRYLIGMAIFIQGVAVWHMSTLNTQMSFDDAAIARMIQSLGLPFLFVPLTQAAYVGLMPSQNNQASALMNVSRNLGGTIGIALVQTMLARRSQVHQAQYVESLNPLNPNYVQGSHGMAQSLMQHGLSQADSAHAATALLYRSLQQQASMLSYIDVFHVLMIIIFAMLPLVLLMRKPEKHGAAGAAAA
jgi:DHA2 family multidrug resistance protein